MKSTYLLLVVLSITIAIDIEVQKKLDQITSTEFGRTIFNTIEVELQQLTSTPLENLIDTLEHIEQNYQRDQHEDDQSNKDFQAHCDQDLNALETELAVLERKKVETQANIDSLVPILALRHGQLTAKEELRSELQQELDNLAAKRQQEEEEFEEKRQEMQFVISVIQEAKRIFQVQQGNSFLQTNTFPQINSHFAKVVTKTEKQKFSKPFSKIFKFLVSMTSSSTTQSPELLSKIVGLCDQLLQKVDEAWTLERQTEDGRVRSYQAYTGLLNSDLNAYNSQIANLEAEISNLQGLLDANTETLNDTVQRIEDKTQRKEDRRNECQEAVFDYQNSRQKRDSDKNTVSQLIGIVHANLRDLKEYVALRVAAGFD